MAVRQLRTGPIGEMGSPVRREWFRSLWESRVLVSLTNLQDLRKYPLLSFFHAPNWTLKTSIIILIARKVPINAQTVQVDCHFPVARVTSHNLYPEGWGEWF